ncbi:MAG: hypothetical protein KJZ79_19580 [Bryobacteraceae bacterium]|nr:hypothetical protein [Bryobacteraceae bacterium]
MRRLLVISVAGALALAFWAANHYRPQPLPPPPSPPPGHILAEIARFDDEVFAYLMFNHLSGFIGFRDVELLLTYENPREDPHYAVIAVFPNDPARAQDILWYNVALRSIAGFEWRIGDQAALAVRRKQTAVFRAAYELPIKRGLDQLSRAEKEEILRRFVRFKSKTDPRIRLGQPVPLLSREEASQIAADILEVADFFDIPIDFFLGIGAMENNYMTVKGDIGNAIWKRRPHKGDIILRRAGGRVLVLNESSGAWQITRETLRLTHQLYLKDTRNYALLPERLRPPREINLDNVKPEHLTTYAGLLFRDLIDRFNGDFTLAAGAYNGGPGRPNLRYAEGVERAATHARTLMEQISALYGRRVVETPFITAVGAGP